MKRKVRYACVEDVGRIRKMNQDNYLVALKNHLPEMMGSDGIIKGKCPSENSMFAVFDGMGGEQCGEMASYMASEEIKRAVVRKISDNDTETGDNTAETGDNITEFGGNIVESDENNRESRCIGNMDKIKSIAWLNESISNANKKINEYMDRNGILSMGTTMASVFFKNDMVFISNVGDSRIYKISEKSMKQISKDHVSIAPKGKKAPLYQYLGIRDEFGVEPYIVNEPYMRGTRYLICSDGLTDMAEDNEIEKVINKYRLSKACRLLNDLAMKNGGRDNISIILLELC